MIRIMEVRGVPKAEFLESAKRAHNFFEETNKPIIKPCKSDNKERYPNTVSLSTRIGLYDPTLLDLLEKK